AVAVYSEVDRLSPHVRAADLAVPLGPPTAAESYLDIGKLVAAAQSSGCEAVHPGYGFLSERAPFAEAVVAASLEFIGPPAAAIRAMGDKTEARRRMQQAGVPIVPGSTRPLADHVQARPEAARLGYPVLLKAAAGGGGERVGLPRGGHDRIPARAGRRVLLPGDEHPAAGRAPGDRARVRGGHRARAAARGDGPAAARARGHAAAARPRHRVSHHRGRP